MTHAALPWFAESLSALLEGDDLSAPQMQAVMESFMSGACGEAEMAALLVALRMKGETAQELATSARVLRAHAIRLDVEPGNLLDTCGTGGDGLGTFNVSTAVALVVAGAGAPVIKHGNRAVSSRSGSADVLAALGVTLREDPGWAKHCLERAGMGFCMAPFYHPAMKHVAGVRRKLGTRTIFNCLGPLINPAFAPHQLLGVGRPEWLDRMAGALAQLGTQRSLLVHGDDGLDEVTLTAATQVRDVRAGDIRELKWTPDDFGLPGCTLEDLQVRDAEQSAAVIRSILNGETSPAANVVLANAAAALWVVGKVDNLRDGVDLARAAIRNGQARKVLNALIAG